MKLFMVAITLLAALASTAHAQVQITISQPAEATTMDPGRSTQVLTVNYFYNLYDALTRWDNSLRLQPGLATSWKNVNETTWEFTLRQGVKFHDGAPLTAEDVKATLERNLQPGKTVVQPGFATIESVQAVNPTTIRIVTKKPDPLLALVAPERLQRQILDRQPAGPALPRADGAGALRARPGEAARPLHRGDADHPRREAVARAVPGSDRVRREPAGQLQAAARLPVDRVGDGA